MRLHTTPVRKTEEKPRKSPTSYPQNRRRKPQKRNSNKHAGTERHSSRDSAQNRVPQSHGVTSPGTWHDTKISHSRFAKSPQKRQVKERCRKAQQTHPETVPTCLLSEDITRQRDSEFDTLHATDPARKPKAAKSWSDCSERSRNILFFRISIT